MRRVALAAGFFLALCASAAAQFTMPGERARPRMYLSGDCTLAENRAITCTKTNGSVLGPYATQASLTAHAVALGNGTGTLNAATIGTAGRLLIDQGAGADPSFNALSQDCTVTSGGVITCTKTNNVAFTAFATQSVPCTLAQGCTAQTSAAAARGSSGLNIDQMTTHACSVATIAATDRTFATTPGGSACSGGTVAWTLPACSAVNPGQYLLVEDLGGLVNGSNTITITRAGSDTINGVNTVVVSSQYGAGLLTCDGTSKWTFYPQAAAGGSGTVTQVNTSAWTSGGPITTTGTITVPFMAAAIYQTSGGV